MHAPDWSSPFEVLRRKWHEVPASDVRISSRDLLRLSDEDLVARWKAARDADTIGDGFKVRGWYHAIYVPQMRGKRVLDVGSGFALSALSFAEAGARLTFTDIVQDNLEVLERLCRAMQIEANFLFIEDETSFERLPAGYDVVTAIGSLICAPEEVSRREVQAILPHLRIGGRWLHLALPRSRWIQEGSPPFGDWGERTDGPGTPWMEYHELETMERLFDPVRMKLLFECEWHSHAFNWFDFERLG